MNPTHARLRQMHNAVDPWRDYRKRRNLVLFAFLGYVPAVFVVGLVTVRWFHTTIPVFVAAFGWMAFYAVAGNLFVRFPCPRCGKWFFAKWWFHNTFARRCVHCGLPKYSDPKPAIVDSQLS